MRTAGCAGGRVQGTVPLTRTRGPPRPFPKDTCSSLINPNGPARTLRGGCGTGDKVTRATARCPDAGRTARKCVHTCACTHIYAQPHSNACTPACTCTRAYAHTYACACMCALIHVRHARVHVSTHTHRHTCICACTHAHPHMHVCAHTCNTHTCVHMHACTHTAQHAHADTRACAYAHMHIRTCMHNARVHTHACARTHTPAHPSAGPGRPAGRAGTYRADVFLRSTGATTDADP